MCASAHPCTRLEVSLVDPSMTLAHRSPHRLMEQYSRLTSLYSSYAPLCFYGKPLLFDDRQPILWHPSILTWFPRTKHSTSKTKARTTRPKPSVDARTDKRRGSSIEQGTDLIWIKPGALRPPPPVSRRVYPPSRSPGLTDPAQDGEETGKEAWSERATADHLTMAADTLLLLSLVSQAEVGKLALHSLHDLTSLSCSGFLLQFFFYLLLPLISYSSSMIYAMWFYNLQLCLP